jgi:cytochrome c oxidase subunit 4
MFSDLQLEDTSYTNGFSLQREKINPIYGISAEGYEGKGFVQSPPAEKQ